LKTDALAPFEDARHVVIIRLRSLGDCVLTTPAIHLLKQHRPSIEIAVVVEPVWRAVFEGNSDIAAILAPRLRSIREFQPDVCIDLHGGNTAAGLTLFSGASHRAGFGHFKRRIAYNRLIPTAQEILGVNRPVHTAEHIASAMFHLGVTPREIPAARLFAAAAAPRQASYAVLHPVAAKTEKTWPADKFLRVAQYLRSNHHLESVFIGAKDDDLSAFSAWPAISGAPLADIKILIAGATLFVGNDSGPAHIAAAFGVPLVVIFGPSDPLIWGPWRAAGEVVQAAGPIGNVDVSQVTAAVDRVGAPV
jgi:ADP-heptose:LPS heptosyltransferase